MVQSIATVIAHSREQLAGNGAQGRVSYVAHNLDVANERDLEADCPGDVVNLSSQRTFGAQGRAEPDQCGRFKLTLPD